MIINSRLHLGQSPARSISADVRHPFGLGITGSYFTSLGREGYELPDDQARPRQHVSNSSGRSWPSASTLDDMDSLAAYIAADNQSAALKVLDRIDRTVENLSHSPTGRWGRVAGTYEKPVRGLPYIIAYALRRKPRGGERRVILRVIHSARDWPEGEWPK